MRLHRKALILGSIALVLLLVLGCQTLAPSRSPELASQERAVEEAPSAGERGIAPAMPVPTAAPAPGEEPGQTMAAGQRLIIQTADIVARVKDVQVAIGQVRALAESYGGYIVSLNTWTDGDQVRATLTIRVPAERFDQMMDRMNAIAEKVESSSVSGQDVTEEYYDIEARLKALKATEEQLTLLLADVRETMKKAEDILAVYRELQNIQSQIEQLEGRKRFLEQMVAMSTINMTLLPVEAEAPVVAQGWQPLRTVKDALRALTGTGQTLIDIIIWLMLYVVPVLLVLAAPFVVLVVVIRAITRRRRNRNKLAPPASEQ
ncbi:MAG: DUF4349 domain-containing protein [Anaerolineae bacterium]